MSWSACLAVVRKELGRAVRSNSRLRAGVALTGRGRISSTSIRVMAFDIAVLTNLFVIQNALLRLMFPVHQKARDTLPRLFLISGLD